MENPFSPSDRDRHWIWQQHIYQDIVAFLAADWAMVAEDFVGEGFFALDALHSADPAQWVLRYTCLADYRDEWLRQAAETRRVANPSLALPALLKATRLSRVEFPSPERALMHKVFDGELPLADGSVSRLAWQSLFTLKAEAGRWKVTSFVGYLPLTQQ